MANRILVEIGYEDRIRAKLGVSEPYLPNEDINYPDIIDIAESNTISQIPNYESLEGDSKVYMESSVVLECCILLCPSMGARLPKKESGPHAGHELYVNWDNKKVELIEERDNLLGKILELDGIATPTPLHFGVTYPKRGW